MGEYLRSSSVYFEFFGPGSFPIYLKALGGSVKLGGLIADPILYFILLPAIAVIFTDISVIITIFGKQQRHRRRQKRPTLSPSHRDITQKVIWPGERSFKPFSMPTSSQYGGTIEETITKFMGDIWAARKASSKELSLSA